MKKEIAKLLNEIGILPNLLGYVYLIEAIYLCISCYPYFYKDLSVKDIYPVLSDKYNSTDANIERNMRHAIQNAWNKKEVQNNIIFKNYEDRPTTKEFIFAIVHYLRFC